MPRAVCCAVQDEGKGLDDWLSSFGLSGVADQLKDLRLGELLDTPPPGIDEAIAIAKVRQRRREGRVCWGRG